MKSILAFSFDRALLGALILIALGCGTNRQDRQFTPPAPVVQSRFSDAEISGKFLDPSRDFLFRESEERSVPFGAVLEAQQSLLRIGVNLGSEDLKKKGLTLFEKSLGHEANSTTLALNSLPYVDSALERYKESLAEFGKKMTAGLSLSRQRVDQYFNSDESQIALPKAEDVRPVDLGAYVRSYLVRVGEGLKKAQVIPEVIAQYQQAVDQGYLKQISAFEEKARRVSPQTPLDQNLSLMRGALGDLQVDKATLDSAEAEFNVAEGYLKKIRTTKDSDAVLVLLVDIWFFLDESMRTRLFRDGPQPGPELYRRFTKFEKDGLLRNCIGVPDCPLSLATWDTISFKTGFWIKVDLKSVLKSLEEGVSTYAIHRFKLRLISGLEKAPRIVEGQLIAGIDKALSQAQQQMTPDSYKGLIGRWLQTELLNGKGRLPQVEAESIGVKYSRQGLGLRSLGANPSSLKALEMGLGLSSSVQIWSLFHNAGTGAQLTQLNKLLAVSGFQKIGGSKAASPLVSVGPVAGPAFDLEGIRPAGSVYWMPQRLSLNYDGSLKPVRNPDQGMRFRIRDQAELLRGASSMAAFLRPWVGSSFDSSLGSITLKRIVPALESESLGQSAVFPKSTLFKLAFGLSAALVQNFDSPRSGLVYLTPDGKWSSSRPQEVFEVAVVDLDESGPRRTINSENLSRLILALDTFLDVLSPLLNPTHFAAAFPELQSTDKAEEAKTLRAKLESAQKSLRLLQFGLGNYLVRQMIDAKDGGVISLKIVSGDGVERKATEDELQWGAGRRIVDQANAIRALLAVRTRLGIEAFDSSIVDIYYFMNREMWSSESGGYRPYESTENSLDPMAALTVLEALTDLRRSQIGLPSGSSEQLDRIVQLYRSQFERALVVP